MFLLIHTLVSYLPLDLIPLLPLILQVLLKLWFRGPDTVQSIPGRIPAPPCRIHLLREVIFKKKLLPFGHCPKVASSPHKVSPKSTDPVHLYSLYS